MLPAEQIFLAKWMRYLQQTWLGGVLGLLAIVVLRRLMGGFTTPLSFTSAVLLGLLVAIHSYVLRLCLRRESWHTWPVLEFDRKVSLATWLLLFAIIIPSTDNLTWMVLLLPWGAMDLYWWCARFEPPVEVSTDVISIPQIPLTSVASDAPREESLAGIVATQRVVHTESYELITGTIQVHFAAEQQTAVVHIPFHPPLSHDPEMIAEADGYQIRVTAAKTYGSRLEVKRSGSSLTSAEAMLSYEALVEKEIEE
jgi:hypothetical protein